MENNYHEELKRMTYEPAKLIVEELEKNYDKLSIEQKKDLVKIKAGLQLYDLEQEEKRQQGGGFRWA